MSVIDRRKTRRDSVAHTVQSLQLAKPCSGHPSRAPQVDSAVQSCALLDIMPPPAGTQTLWRGLVLEAVGVGVRGLHTFEAALGMTRSTTRRLTSSLVQARYLRQVQGDYMLGPKLVELGAIALKQIPLTVIARPHLERLAEQTLETIHLGVRDGDDVRCIDRIPGTRGLEMRSRVGRRVPLVSAGIGKAMMLDLPPDAWHSLFKESSRSFTGVSLKPDNRSDPLIFMRRMADYSMGGYAFDLEENEASIRCVAVPLRDASGAVVAALSVSGTVRHMSFERMHELIPVVRCEARAISEELGRRVPQPTTLRIKR